MKSQRGFTLVEILIAMVLLTVGLGGLVSTAALATRMIGRGQRSGVAAMFAARRLEQLRVTACTAQAAGSDTLYRGGTWVAINSWTFSNPGNSTWSISFTSTYKTAGAHTRTDKSETEISCVF